MKSLVTLGTFDGVHRGHQALIRNLVADARRLHLSPHVVLFGSPPRFFFQPGNSTPLITTEQERTRLLRNSGVKRITVLRFDASVAAVTHVRFFERFLVRGCRAGGLLVGPDFAFGKGRLGDIRWLRDACRARGLYFHIHPLLRSGDMKVSSSRIRERLIEGDAAKAAQLLGRPHRVAGRVIQGQGLGARIGIPTANLEVSSKKIVPRGVFQVRVFGPGPLRDGRLGVCNVGVRPTVGGKRRVHVEVHIPKFSANLYGQRLSVDFLRRLRRERKFPSLKALIAQIRRDIRRIR